MDFSTLIKERYSVRQFKDTAVSKEDIELILEAGRIAPTAKNMQPVFVVALTSQDGLKIANACSPCIYGAPVVFVVCGDKSRSFVAPDGRDFLQMDATIVTTQMMLKAHDLGLGSCFVGMFDADRVRKKLNLPEEMLPIAFLPVGYIDAPPSERHEMRKPMSEFAEIR